MQQTPFHAYYTARQLDTLPDADKLLPVFASSDIQAYPFQIAAASFMDLRTREQLKIHCGKKHFEALENGIEMQVATDWHEIKARV